MTSAEESLIALRLRHTIKLAILDSRVEDEKYVIRLIDNALDARKDIQPLQGS